MTMLNEKSRQRVVKKKPLLTLGNTLGVLNFLLILFLIINMFNQKDKNATPLGINNLFKNVGIKLQGNGVDEESAYWFEKHFTHGDLPALEQANVAFQIGMAYFKKSNYEKALGWFFTSESLDPKASYASDRSNKIVATLEGLKRFSFAKYQLGKRTSINSDSSMGSTPGGKKVARIGKEIITNNEIEKALSKLPPEMAKKFANPQARNQFITQYVAEKLIFRKALRQGINDRPAIREKLDDITRNVLVSEIVKEQLGNIQATETDLQSYYQANKDKFQNKPFEEVKQQVAQMYSQIKVGELYQKLIMEAVQTEDVEIYPEQVNFSAPTK